MPSLILMDQGEAGGRERRGRAEGEGQKGKEEVRQAEGREGRQRVERGCFRENNRCQLVCLIDHGPLAQRLLRSFSGPRSEFCKRAARRERASATMSDLCLPVPSEIDGARERLYPQAPVKRSMGPGAVYQAILQSDASCCDRQVYEEALSGRIRMKIG